MSDLLHNPTIDSLAEFLDKTEQSQVNKNTFQKLLAHIQAPWVVIPENKHAKRYLIYFHCAGGSCSQVFRWQTLLDQSLQLVGIQLPGHDKRIHEPAFDNIELLIDPIALELKDLFEKPVYLMGHSMGALLAFAVCQKLLEWNINPQALLVIASRSPQNLPTNLLSDITTDDAFLQKIASIGGINPDFLRNKQLVNTLLPTLRSDTHASERYFSNKKIAVPIIAMSGKNDLMSPPSTVALWQEMTLAKFVSNCFDGNHFFMQQHENAFIDYLNHVLTYD